MTERRNKEADSKDNKEHTKLQTESSLSEPNF